MNTKCTALARNYAHEVAALVQNYSISIPNTLETLQPCTKPPMYALLYVGMV